MFLKNSKTGLTNQSLISVFDKSNQRKLSPKNLNLINRVFNFDKDYFSSIEKFKIYCGNKSIKTISQFSKTDWLRDLIASLFRLF